MTTNTISGSFPAVYKVAQSIADAFQAWQLRRSRYRAEMALRHLSPHALKDIGFHHSEIGSVVHGDPRDRIRHYRGY